jgi:hypothetical protein
MFNPSKNKFLLFHFKSEGPKSRCRSFSWNAKQSLEKTRPVGAKEFRAHDRQRPPSACRSEEFEVLLNNYMFDLIAFREMDGILEEFKRVLKKSGKLVLVNMTRGERFGSGLYEIISRFPPKSMGGCRGGRMSQRLTKRGFQVDSREYHQQLFFPWGVIVARKSNII